MTPMVLNGAGMVEITGADVFGGELIPIPGYLVKIGAAVFTATLAAVAANWADFKDGVFEGYNSATH